MADRRTVTAPTRADVVIVGGGVAGSSLAGALARAGLGVVVVEREARFRDRIRGEALHPWGASEVARLGLVDALVAAGALPLPIWQTYHDRVPDPPYRWRDDAPDDRVEWGVPHAALQAALLDRAAAAGATVLRPATATGARPVPGGAEVDVESAQGALTLRARLVVGADGRRSVVRRWLGAELTTDPPHHEIGGVLLAGATLDRTSAHVARWPGGMTTSFPQAGERARVYWIRGTRSGPAAGAAAQIVRAVSERFPPGAFSRATVAGPAAFFSCSDVWPTSRHGRGMVLVGDAAGANDPAQGHGLSLAFHDARMLGDLLTSDRDWDAAVAAFGRERAAIGETLLEHGRWVGRLTIDEGPGADRLRERVARARDADPAAGGFAGIYLFGPFGLVADGAARRHFFGEDF